MAKVEFSVNEDHLLDALVLYTKLFHKPFSEESLLSGLPMHDSQGIFSKDSSKSLFSRIAARAGLKSTLVKKELDQILTLHLPMILLLSNENVCILEDFNSERTKAKIIYPDGDGLQEWVDVSDLNEVYLGFGFLLKKAYVYKVERKKVYKIDNMKFKTLAKV